ncbi:enediyne biosynthesis protein, partial [Burkholderia multivorans]
AGTAPDAASAAAPATTRDALHAALDKLTGGAGAIALPASVAAAAVCASGCVAAALGCAADAGCAAACAC